MACSLLSALVSLYIQAAKTDNQIYPGLFGEQILCGGGGGGIIGKRINGILQPDTEIPVTFFFSRTEGKQINAIMELKQQEQLLK